MVFFEMKKFNVLLVLLLYVKFTICDINYNLNLIQKNDFGYNGEAYLNPYPRECFEILEAFAAHASNFTSCSILHARPIRLCEKCVDNYIHFHAKYQELLKTVINGTSCGSLFMAQDRLNTIKQQHDSLLTIWDGGHCNTCFDWGTNGPELKNDTKNFIKKFNNTMECIISNLGPEDDIVCEKCMSTYIDLDEFYKSLSEDSIGVDSVCMDIVDSMNTTRSIWSKTLKCCGLRKSPEIFFLCCTGIISSLPLIFYLAVRFCRPVGGLQVTVLKDSRFKQYFSEN
ncbi:osteopetrosis-associated transmembrane protein 1 [Aricia agestis]|uniref:osteopetrosis-associated transmembrane protein 1 n=1 Tax=Aricia agestis TaxID=91739 RepID=UPI001C203A17|nr:osteopetrosis-associated transmembrane protein 1 [Aricia agestis]